MLAASQSHAVVVYSGVVNLAMPATNAGLYMNVVTGANNIASGTGGGTVAGWDINIYSTTSMAFYSNPNVQTVSGTVGSYVTSASLTVGNLAAGTTVGPASSFSGTVNTVATQWVLNSSNNLFGFRFVGEDNLIHYGWARIKFGSTLTARTLVEYGYESVAATGLAAGVSAVPEPSSAGLMGLGLGLGALLFTRRRHQA